MVFSIARHPHINIKSNLAFPLSTSVLWLGCDFSHGRHSGVVVWPHARFVRETEEDEVRDHRDITHGHKLEKSNEM